jgi:hypothetical protein
MYAILKFVNSPHTGSVKRPFVRYEYVHNSIQVHSSNGILGKFFFYITVYYPQRPVFDNERENFSHTHTRFAQAPDNLDEWPPIGLSSSMKTLPVKPTSTFITNFILSCII